MLEAYLFENFFDQDGIMYAYIDRETGKPFTSEFMSTQYLDLFHVPDPVHYWSNEDSMQYSGYLLAALYEKYMATKDARVIDLKLCSKTRRVIHSSRHSEKGKGGTCQ